VIVVDTHVWVWWLSAPDKLTAKARRALDAATEVGVSAISCWELAMLVAKNRIELDRDVLLWIQQALAQPRMNLFPLSPEVAVASTRLEGGFHGDPGDRLIAATCLYYRARLVTKDERLRRYRPLTTVW
jgi:PIN domain nuclease of toxin-antitoxin system